MTGIDEVAVPFTIHVPDAVLDDLGRRLASTHWSDPAIGQGWAYGADLDYLRDLLAYWQHTFDWRAGERRLNADDHRLLDVGGLAVHVQLHASRSGDGRLAPGAAP